MRPFGYIDNSLSNCWFKIFIDGVGLIFDVLHTHTHTHTKKKKQKNIELALLFIYI